jgi:hypothetical protein
MLAGWITAGYFLFYLTMRGGGFLGIFLNWCLGLMLLVPTGFLIRDLTVSRPQTFIRMAIGILSLAGLTALSLWLIGDLVVTWRSNSFHDLTALNPNSGYTKTRFEFHKDDSNFVIRDPSSRLRFCFGAIPSSIRIEGGERVIVFDNYVILKSWTFDYGFEGKVINFGGWMGAASSALELEIGPDGLPIYREKVVR